MPSGNVQVVREESPGHSGTLQCGSAYGGSHPFPVQWDSLWASASQHRSNHPGKIPPVSTLLLNSPQHEAHFHLRGTRLCCFPIQAALSSREESSQKFLSARNDRPGNDCAVFWTLPPANSTGESNSFQPQHRDVIHGRQRSPKSAEQFPNNPIKLQRQKSRVPKFLTPLPIYSDTNRPEVHEKFSQIWSIWWHFPVSLPRLNSIHWSGKLICIRSEIPFFRGLFVKSEWDNFTKQLPRSIQREPCEFFILGGKEIAEQGATFGWLKHLSSFFRLGRSLPDRFGCAGVRDRIFVENNKAFTDFSGWLGKIYSKI